MATCHIHIANYSFESMPIGFFSSQSKTFVSNLKQFDSVHHFFAFVYYNRNEYFNNDDAIIHFKFVVVLLFSSVGVSIEYVIVVELGKK